MIRNIVFDMGQVLIRWQPAVMTAKLGLTPEDGNLLSRELLGNVEWVMLDRGILTQEEVVAQVCQRLPERLHGVARQLTTGWWKKHLEPVEGMESLIARLKELGYGIYLLSNANLDLRTYFPRVPGSQFFDGLMVSAEEQLLKPQPEIFRQLYRRFSLVPEECVFIDDSSANAEAARLTGMDSIVFYGDVQRLRRELAQRGIDAEKA